MLTLENDSDTAIVVLHEIYGLNQYTIDTCRQYHSLGFTVYCPNILELDEAFSYENKDAAYSYFVNNIGFAAASGVERLVEALNTQYSYVYLIGFSIGATIAWLTAAAIPCSGIICHYGSRIRDYVALKLLCPALLIFAEQDVSFPIAKARESFLQRPGIVLEIIEGEHGFCDKYGSAYHHESAMKAKRLVDTFILKGSPKKAV